MDLIKLYFAIILQVVVGLEQVSYTFSESDNGAEVCIAVQSGVVQQSFTVGYGSFGVTAGKTII